MIEGEYTDTHSKSPIAGENSSQLEGKNTILAETNAETQPTSQLEVRSGVLVERGIEIQSKITPNQCENLVDTDEQSNTAVLSTKELVYAISTSTNSSTILSLSESDALNSNGPIESENSVNFEAQTVLSTTESGLLEGLINPSQKNELSVENIENQLDINNSALNRDTENINDHAIATESEDLPEDLGDIPPWAAQLKGCERIGDSYRGYVHTEAELDVLLSMHKEHTHSSWGTRQSPSSQKPSVRFMWKSQYVPYDGIPFLNSGRRATVMECQYGPRRKGNKVKVEYNENGEPVKRAHRPTCPARIYVKRVRKFPEYKVDKSYEGTPGLRLAQERALTALRVACLESRGEERFYVQFPLEIAHEYHQDDDEMMPHQALSLLPTQVNLGSSRLDPRVVEKINELVARGVTDIYQVKHGIIHFVEKDLFLGVDEPIPARHNKSFFPTITDLQNHVHQALLALESGTLESLPPPENPPKASTKDERSSKRKRTEPRRVRAPKTPIRTICIRTDDPLELARDPSLQDTQGQVYVMVPSASSLFANSESLIGTSLEGDKATSLVQVLTVPANSSAFLGQQADGTLDLTGQFLALPVVNCDNQEQISTSQNSGMVIHDSLGKEPISVIPATMDNSLNKIDIQTPNMKIPSTDNTIPTPMSPSAIDVLPPTVTMATTIPPTVSIPIQRVPSTITMATPGLDMATANSTVSNLHIAVTSPSRADINVISNTNLAMANTAVVNTNSTVMPDLVMTSPHTSSTVPKTSRQLITTSSTMNLKSEIPNKSSDVEMTSSYAVATPSEIMTSSLTESTTSSEVMTSPSKTASITSSDINMTSGVPTSITSRSITSLQDVPMTYDPTTSSILITSSDERSLKTLDTPRASVANIHRNSKPVM